MPDVWGDKLVCRITHSGWRLYNLAGGENSSLPIEGVPAFSVEHDHLCYTGPPPSTAYTNCCKR